MNSQGLLKRNIDIKLLVVALDYVTFLSTIYYKVYSSNVVTFGRGMLLHEVPRVNKTAVHADRGLKNVDIKTIYEHTTYFPSFGGAFLAIFGLLIFRYWNQLACFTVYEVALMITRSKARFIDTI